MDIETKEAKGLSRINGRLLRITPSSLSVFPNEAESREIHSILMITVTIEQNSRVGRRINQPC